MNTLSKLKALPILGLLAVSLITVPVSAQADDRYKRSEWSDYQKKQSRQHRYDDQHQRAEHNKHGLKHRVVNEQRREYRKELRREQRQADRRAERRAERRHHRMEHRYERNNQRHYVINHHDHYNHQPHKHHDGRKLIRGIIGLSILGHMLNH